MLPETIIEILLVEDNPDDEELAVHGLTTAKVGNSIRVIRDGAEALDFLFHAGKYYGPVASESPSLILLDLHLPKIDGLEVLRRVKSDPLTSHIPVVVMTSSRDDRSLAACYALGATKYIVKPVDFEQLIESVRGMGLYWVLLNQPLLPSDP